MIRHADIQYRTPWVRAICCLSLAVCLVNASRFEVLSGMDLVLQNVITDNQVAVFPRSSVLAESSIVMLACLLPAVIVFEQPFAMLLYGLALLFSYTLGTALVMAWGEVLLPVASPFLGIAGSVAVLQTMAWSDERARRIRMEQLDNVRLQFTDMLVHDLRKRMSSLLISLSLIEKQKDGPHAQDDLLATLHASAERTLLEINNLLDLRRMEQRRLAIAPERLVLAKVIRESMEEHEAAARLAGVRLTAAELPEAEIVVDADILSRILTNLFWNAIQHGPQGSDILVDSALDERFAAISISNRGDPIPVDRQSRMFDAYGNDGDSSSMGLGLSFCRLAAEAHGGSIGVESPDPAMGTGTRITLRLPRFLHS